MSSRQEELGSGGSNPRFQEALEKVLAQSEIRGSVLDRPLGPSSECYSIHHMVNLFRWGANKEDVDHLSGCDPCRLWADNYAKSASAKVARQSKVAKSLRDQVVSWFGKSTKTPPVAPMLYIKDELISVEKPKISMELALVAGISDAASLDVGSLRLEGNLSSSRATLMKQQIAGNEYVVVRFEDVQLADSLRVDVQNHAAVVQQVCLTGKFTGQENLTLRGQANVHVGKIAIASMPAFRSHNA